VVERGLLDTSVVIDLDSVASDLLPETLAISAITLAELSAGPAAASSAQERAIRQDRLQRVEATFESMPFDAAAARAYGRVYAAVMASGRKPRRRFADLQIAATALALDVPLVTRNAKDFAGLEGLVHLIEV